MDLIYNLFFFSNRNYFIIQHLIKNMKRKYKKKPKEDKKIAKERIVRLFELAETAFKKNKTTSKRYVSLARKISLRNKTRIPPKLRKKMCKHCGTFLMPGSNCRIRNTNSKMVYTCLECKQYMRFPIHRKKK